MPGGRDMKAISYEKFGTSEVLKVNDLVLPELLDNEVQIRIAYTSVNPVDWKIREGYLEKMFPHIFPIIPGWDVAGEIVKIGAKVKDFAKGDLVYAYARKPEVQFGSYAELINLDHAAVANAPKTLSLEKAGSVPLVALTAWQGLVDHARIGDQDTVLITAGAGGVGSFAIQIAKLKGAKVITTASSHNHDYVRSLGADHVIDYNNESVKEVVKSIVSEGVDVVFDAAGGSALGDAWSVIKNGGRLISIVDTPDEQIAKEKGVEAQFVFVSPDGEGLKKIAQKIDAGQIKEPAITVRNIKEAGLAHDENKKGHTRGKIVLEVVF